ncbi:HNH endonuclease [Skermanella aerolata]|nr:HNH endonuclease [Skermanella aerolata]
MDKLAGGEEPTKADKGRYAHPEIKAALVAETHGKCAYCESKVRHIAHGDIEHVVPKSVVPARWFDWDNLTLSCDICNGRKSDFHGDHDTFIDPYAVDPEQHFWIVGETVFPRPGCDAAALTERLLGLNRAELVERRSERLKGLMKLLEVIERTVDPNLKGILQADFAEEAAEDKEYAALAREVMRMAHAKLGHAAHQLA